MYPVSDIVLGYHQILSLFIQRHRVGNATSKENQSGKANLQGGDVRWNADIHRPLASWEFGFACYTMTS